MIIRKNFSRILACMLFVAIAMSCEDLEPETYNGTPFVSFNEQAASISVSENEASRTVELGITLAYSSDVTIDLTVVDDTATQGVDYTLSSSSVVIPAGEYVGSFTINPVDNSEFNESKLLTIEITNVSVSGVSLGNANEASRIKDVIIVNDDCPTQTSLWWGTIDVEDVGFGVTSGTGGGNATGDCDVLSITNDLPGGGASDGPFDLFFTPSFLGATSGTVSVPDQLYCTACSAGLDAFYSATGTYDEATQSIVLFYSLDRSDGANFWTGTNVITIP